jgi:pimeloyl-ACP methyl ester carboxylesterase
MDTLRSFVEAVLPEPRSDRVKYLSVPDRMSESFELRKLLAPQTRTRPITDFFEYYWAYQVRGTKYKHLVVWLRDLLLRFPSNVPRRLLALWMVTWLLVAGIAMASYRLAPLLSGARGTDSIHRIVIWAVSVLLLPLVSAVALEYLGDAARYLSPTPQNIAVRQRIRGDGVQLLRQLHRSGLYDRIVVVGHSLGSVIAYDILKHYWQEVNSRHGASLKVDQSKLKSVEIAAARLGSTSDSAASLIQFQERQRELWQEQRRLGNPWLVSDLITVGSPLTHAAMLLANTPAELLERQREMELPVVPPHRNLEGEFAYRVHYAVQGQKRTLRVLHHGAMFACTRWTNIYFPGDFVGGPLAPLFGRGVNDRLVRDSWVSFTPASHTRYWTRPVPGAPPGEALTALREALDLDSKEWIA